MFKKQVLGAMGVVGILSLVCLADAGDLMIWSPRTPAGGGNPGFIGSYLGQAAAVEYGPEGTVGRDIVKPETRQYNYYQSETSSTQSSYDYDEATQTGTKYLIIEDKTTTVQKQESGVYYPNK